MRILALLLVVLFLLLFVLAALSVLCYAVAREDMPRDD